MGTEAEGTLTVGGQKVNVRADFASDHVKFSGGRRGEVPYSAIEVVSTAKGILRLRVDGAPMEFPLGTRAERIANKIRKPPTLMDKLGIAPGLRVAAVGVPSSLLRQARAVVAVDEHLPRQPADLVLLGVDDLAGLEAISDAAAKILPDGGGLWVVYPKGRRDLREADVLAAGRAAGLRDVKVARISASHTALRFMHPRH